MTLRCAIVDDDSVFVKLLEHYLSKVTFMKLTEKYMDANSASLSLDFNKIDLLFLDVEMPGMSGLEFLDTLPVIPPVIFVSKKKEYGVEAFDHDSIDYLHKPVSFPRFLVAVNKAKIYFRNSHKPANNNKESLFIRKDRMWVRIPINEISYIKADDNDVIIKASEKIYKTNVKLMDIYSRLPRNNFMQVHRSYLVNLQKIDKIDGEIIEINSRSIPVSKLRIKELHRRLNII